MFHAWSYWKNQLSSSNLAIYNDSLAISILQSPQANLPTAHWLLLHCQWPLRIWPLAETIVSEVSSVLATAVYSTSRLKETSWSSLFDLVSRTWRKDPSLRVTIRWSAPVSRLAYVEWYVDSSTNQENLVLNESLLKFHERICSQDGTCEGCLS